jgi:hypothetical protein
VQSSDQKTLGQYNAFSCSHYSFFRRRSVENITASEGKVIHRAAISEQIFEVLRAR